MRLKPLATIILSVGFLNHSYSQITEAEKPLKQQSADTIKGWKKGG